MFDVFGKTLHIGDSVIYMQPCGKYSHRFAKAVVVGQTPKRIRIAMLQPRARFMPEHHRTPYPDALTEPHLLLLFPTGWSWPEYIEARDSGWLDSVHW